jgi:hypothetical protein
MNRLSVALPMIEAPLRSWHEVVLTEAPSNGDPGSMFAVTTIAL